jgi:hypothetical protein
LFLHKLKNQAYLGEEIEKIKDRNSSSARVAKRLIACIAGNRVP